MNTFLTIVLIWFALGLLGWISIVVHLLLHIERIHKNSPKDAEFVSLKREQQIEAWLLSMWMILLGPIAAIAAIKIINADKP